MQMNYQKFKKLLSLLASVLIVLAFSSSCAKQSKSLSANNKVSDKWVKVLTSSIDNIEAWGEITVNIGDKKYVSGFVASLNNSNINMQFIDPFGITWWELVGKDNKYIVTSDGKIKAGKGDFFLKKQLGFSFTINELKAIIAGRPLLQNKDSIYIEGDCIVYDKTKIHIMNDKIVGWENRQYKVEVSDYRKIKRQNQPFKIEVDGLKNKVHIIIRYAQVFR